MSTHADIPGIWSAHSDRWLLLLWSFVVRPMAVRAVPMTSPTANFYWPQIHRIRGLLTGNTSGTMVDRACPYRRNSHVRRLALQSHPFVQADPSGYDSQSQAFYVWRRPPFRAFQTDLRAVIALATSCPTDAIPRMSIIFRSSKRGQGLRSLSANQPIHLPARVISFCLDRQSNPELTLLADAAIRRRGQAR